jgi:fluoroquinolone transport system permease protein
MKAINVLKSLGPIDLRNIWRDSALGWMGFIPILCALILRWGVPPLTAALFEQYAFDLSTYYPVLLSYFLILMCPVLFGVLIGFLLLDERDDNTLSALQVTPLTMTSYLVYRIVVPVIMSIVLMFIIFPIANLGTLAFWPLLITTIVAAPMAPMFALFLGAFAENKVQGFALMKGSGVILFVPIFAFFIESKWELVFGVLPTYWPLKVYWLLEAGRMDVWLYVLFALVYQFVVIGVFLRRFTNVLHQ